MTLDISTDYLGFDFLVSVEYQSLTAEDTWSSAVAVDNCSFFDAMTSADVSGDDLRRTYAGIIIRFPEWSDELASMPARGDKFTLSGKIYSVEDVDADPVRRMQWTMRCYTI